MAQENSVLFALRDLRTLESDRLAEEARLAAIEAERRRAEEAERRADEERRRAGEDARVVAQKRAEDAAAEMARALRETAGRNEQLESDVQTLRALVSAVQPIAPRARVHWPALLVATAALVLGGALWSRRAPIVHERIVYAPASIAPPAAAPVPAPVAAPVAAPVVRAAEPPPRSHPPHVTRRPMHKTQPPAGSKMPSILDCDGTDPLCGTNL